MVRKQRKICPSTRSSQDILAIGIEPHAPEPDPRGQLLRPLQLPVPTKDGLDKLPARVVAHVQLFASTIAFCSLEHVLLANLQQFVETFPKSFSTVEEIVNEFAIIAAADARQTLFGAFDLASELDEGEPEVAGHLGDRSRGPVEGYCPIVDPFAEAVCIEDAAEKKDGLFIGVPVLEVVAGGYTCCSRIAVGGNGAFGWCLLTWFRRYFARC
jgi:hypothetical protein